MFITKSPVDNNPACIDLDNDGLAPNRRQDIIWNNVDMIYWRIYAAIGGDGLR